MIRNIEVKLSGDARLPLSDCSLDGAILVFRTLNGYEHADFLYDLSRILKEQGRLFFITSSRDRSLDETLLDVTATRAGLHIEKTFQWFNSLFFWPIATAQGRMYRKSTNALPDR
jgi:ubiquinone/menaquinone biosynthesis C-methylase UbiE